MSRLKIKEGGDSDLKKVSGRIFKLGVPKIRSFAHNSRKIISWACPFKGLRRDFFTEHYTRMKNAVQGCQASRHPLGPQQTGGGGEGQLHSSICYIPSRPSVAWTSYPHTVPHSWGGRGREGGMAGNKIKQKGTETVPWWTRKCEISLSRKCSRSFFVFIFCAWFLLPFWKKNSLA